MKEGLIIKNTTFSLIPFMIRMVLIMMEYTKSLKMSLISMAGIIMDSTNTQKPIMTKMDILMTGWTEMDILNTTDLQKWEILH